MANLAPVQGFWRDNSQGRFFGSYLTVNDGWYTFIGVTIGVIFGLSQPRVEILLSHAFAWVGYAIYSFRSRRREVQHTPDENARLLEGQAMPAQQSVPQENKSYSRQHPTFARLVSILLLVFGTGLIVSGGFVNKYPDGNTALSGAKTCGLWGLVDTDNTAAQDQDSLYQSDRETRAGEYSRDCYRSGSSKGISKCLLFKEQHIPSRVESQQECPFVNSTFCPGNGYTAVRFTTDLVSAQEIGVNANKAPRFNRTAICVPVNLDAGFAVDLGEGKREGDWGYKLGPKESDEYSSEYTFRQYSDPFTFDVRSYTMSTYVHIFPKHANDNYWQPIADLDVRPGLTTSSKPYSFTLMFVNTCRIFYTESSADPIFPATQWIEDEKLWIAEKPRRARPLACLDWIEMVTENGDYVSPYPLGPPGLPRRDNQYQDLSRYDNFTRFALNKSTIYEAIQYRGAVGLDAQDKIRDGISLPIAKDQWVVESWSMFNTSLSRVQYDALDISNGTGSDNRLYELKTPGDMCGIFAFKLPSGYNDVRWPRHVLLLGTLALLAILGCPTKQQFSGDKEKASGYFTGKTKLNAEVAATWVWNSWLMQEIVALFGRSTGRPAPSAAPSDRSHGTNSTSFGTFSGDSNSQADAPQSDPAPPPRPSTSAPRPITSSSGDLSVRPGRDSP